MNVLVLLHDSYGSVGGIAKFNRDLLAALAADRRVETITVLPRRAPVEAPPSLPKLHMRAAPGGGKPGYFAAALREGLIGGARDLVIAAHLRLLPAAMLARRGRRPLWAIVHGIDAWEPCRPRLDPWLVRGVDRVISACSPAVSGCCPIAWTARSSRPARPTRRCRRVTVLSGGAS
jgi:glycosyltransferase involved in cell wall biosynthesis